MIRLGVFLALVLSLLAVGCSDDENDVFSGNRSQLDGGNLTDPDGPGVCDLNNCPSPPVGVACCTPLAQCGVDPLGLGLNCAPLPGGALSDSVCVLDECPLPIIGSACCTPFGLCGNDPYASGQVCFANPPPVNLPVSDAGPTCDLLECPTPEVGLSCCLPNGECGVDPWQIGFCLPPPVEVDAEPLPPLELPAVMTEPPDDPSVDGQCPSFLGFAGPVWGCCSDFGICGTFAFEECLLPVGTPLSVDGADAGPLPEGLLGCTPPGD